MDKIIKWNLLIFLSTAAIICGALSAFVAIITQIYAATNKHVGFYMYKPQSLMDYFILYPTVVTVIFSIIAIVCFVSAVPLTKMRQKARDEVEFDENGISRSKGKFSQLSKAERDAINKQKMIDQERILPTTMLKTITHCGPKDPDLSLNKLIGMENVKYEIKKMRARMEYEKNLDSKQKDKYVNTDSSMNMIFTGAPGTGKTSLARIITSYLYQYGYIKKNQIIEVDGNFCNGLSTGESSKKISMLINAAKGGVLFIDEAYSLLSTGGQEVIATIVKAMEDYRDEMVFIFAGYENEMKALINSNPGIESRAKYIIHFNDYSYDDFKAIFAFMANEKNLYVSYDVLDKVADILENEKRTNRNFGNARSVRTLLDKIIDNHAFNIANKKLDESYMYKLHVSDLP